MRAAAFQPALQLPAGGCSCRGGRLGDEQAVCSSDAWSQAGSVRDRRAGRSARCRKAKLQALHSSHETREKLLMRGTSLKAADRCDLKSTRKPGVSMAILDVPPVSGSAGGKQEGRTLPSSFSPVGNVLGIESASYASAEQRVHEVVVKEAAAAALLSDVKPGLEITTPELMLEAYERCGEVCAEYAKTFYLGTKLMTPERQRAIWAIYVWCRRTDELVDGPNAPRITPRALDRWEERLEDVFSGRPYDMLDAALADTVKTFPVNIQPFRDMVEGMRMDLRKSRYADFNELYLYCYNVAGTVGLMSVPVMGISPFSKADPVEVYSAALALGIANQLTNILRDVGEDARRRRIYLPQDELEHFGLRDEDIFAGVVTEKWRDFMRFQIKRARSYFMRAEQGVPELDEKSRWPVWASLSLYRQILDAVEANDYDNFTKRAYVPKWKKLLSLPGAYARAQLVQPARSWPKQDQGTPDSALKA